MEYKLTSSQANFFTKNATIDGSLWSQGVMELFPKVYSYKELNDAYNRLVEANDSLRVVIKEDDEGPVAVVEDFSYTEFSFFTAESDDDLMQKAQAFLNAPIDIHGRLVDCAVFQTPTNSGIMIRAHHIVVDGYSAFVMSEHVNKYIKEPDCISPENQSYKDYIEKETKHRLSKRFNSDKTFWKEAFRTLPDCTLFTVGKNPLDYSSEELNASISPDLFNKIKAICENNDISPASFFNAVYSIYINKRFDSSCFTLGVPVLNRTTQAELNTIGLYMHLVPLVVSIENCSFIDTAKKIEDSQLNLFRHQKFTQGDIKEMLDECGLASSQLFDVVCDYQEFSRNSDYEMRIPYSNSLSVPLEIHLQSFDKKQYNLKIRYRTAYFSQGDIQQILDSILTIAEFAANNPYEHTQAIPIYSQKLLKVALDFSKGDTFTLPINATIYSLFEENAKKTPNKVCIKADGKEITFGEFINIAEQLDCEIRKYTKGEKRVIGVICDRSVEMYAAIYGIIRGGNAYMPIAPDYPQDRIEYMLKNSNAPVAIAQSQYCSLAGESYIDITAFIENLPSNHILPYACEENDTAYVIYTSGSTGKPKGAKISHKSAINRILWMHDKYPLAEDGVILQKTPYTFDVSVWEIFWWGMLGGCLAVSKPNEHFLPAKILEETQKNKVTHLHFVPSVFDLFLTHLETHKEECEKFKTVERVFLSGEALSAALINRFYTLFDYDKVKLHNLYGPTECAVDVTYYDCAPNALDPVPIGKPIYNTAMYVVDKNTKLVPVGVKGELCIGGVNVGQGYLNNPELTAEKFIDNPFGDGKLYKTGDLAYWREDGEIIFCGRIDSQIKLNGQRIETGEIESVISSVDGVEAAAVLVGKANGVDTLVAYCCCPGTLKEDIKKTCIEKLPLYMVPQAFVFIDEMPLNTSGKLDRKKLMALNITVDDVKLEPPQNKTEEIICNLFCEILGIEKISRNSDFFNLGGTSLSMISALSKDVLNGISAPEFIENSTPEKLANILGAKESKHFKYLKALHKQPSSQKAFILFPYAGGGAESYAAFAKAFEKRTQEYSLYFVDFLRTSQECREAAAEIAELAKNNDVYFYSHCAGSAVALQILQYIEKNNMCKIEHYIAGGSLPLKKPLKNNIWNYVPDVILKKILSSAGADLKELEKEHISALLHNFRNDTDFMTNYYYTERNNTILCPVSLVISKTDIFTKHYKFAKELWSAYAANISNICFIDTSSHYFQSANSNELVDIIQNILK